MTEDRFEPWLGTSGQDMPLFRQLWRRARVLGWAPGDQRRPGVLGHNMRGGGVACVLKASQGVRPLYRTATVSARIVRFRSTGKNAVYQHLRYLSRDGKGRTGECPELYSNLGDNIRKVDFSELTGDHRHQFRMVVEPENGWEYSNLQPLVRKLMKQVGQDLRVDLDWVAADHFDNGSPHAHIAVAGRDRRGDDILIAPPYLRQCLSQRAAEIVSLDLGPKSAIEAGPDIDLTVERVIAVDIELLERADRSGRLILDSGDAHQGLLTKRLISLTALGLASRESHGAWRLDPDILLELGKIEKRNRDWSALQHEVSARSPDRPRSDYAAWDDRRDKPAVGRVLAANPIAGNEWEIIIDTVEGELLRAQGPTDVYIRPDMIVMFGKAGTQTGDVPLEQPRQPKLALSILSEHALELLVESRAPNWLDHVASQPEEVWLGKGFGQDVRQSLAQRYHWLRIHSHEHDVGQNFGIEI